MSILGNMFAEAALSMLLLKITRSVAKYTLNTACIAEENYYLKMLGCS